MSKILITLLGSEVDTIKASYLINSLVKENPHTEVHVLTFEHLKNATNLVSNISQAHYINSSEIQTIFENQLFSNSFAINSFFESIHFCIDTNWDKIINFSNDNISSYITSMLNANNKIGTTISEFGSPLTSNQWATYLNFVNSSEHTHLIDNNTVRHHMCHTPFHKDGMRLKVNDEYSAIASQNFAKIRASKATTPNANIVAISLQEGYNNEHIDLDSLSEIIDTLETSERYRVVLLLSGTERERKIANELNHKFNNDLISINTDSTAFPSVIINCDTLITVQNSHLLIADALDTKIIEISQNCGKNSSPWTVCPGNYSIYQEQTTNLANDINLILNQEFETQLPVASMDSNNKVYAIIEDDYGVLATQIRGELNLANELRYHIERCFHYQLLGYNTNAELINHIRENTNKKELESFATQVKDELTDTVKVLLATLRSLKGVKQSKSNLQSFITYLDNLIQKGHTESITRAAISIFEGELENINTQDSEENMKAIENKLFKLKSNLQILTNLISDLLGHETDKASSDNIEQKA